MPSSKMYAPWVNHWQLQLHDGTTSQWITPSEANRRIARGEGLKIKRKARQPFEILRLHKPVAASNSAESPACITVTDMRIFAGEIECGRGYLSILREKLVAFRPLAFTVIVITA